MAALANDTQHLERLRTYWKRHHAFPSMAKLCEVVGMSSTASVFNLVSRLKEAGYVERVEGRIAPTKRFFARLLVGIVAPACRNPGRTRATSRSSPSTITWCRTRTGPSWQR